MAEPLDLPDIRNITISGRIGSGASTLAEKLAATLGWDILDGGKLFRKISTEIGLDINKSNTRPDHFDLEYEAKITKMLKDEKNHVIQSHLAGYDAQNIPNVFKILVICEDKDGNDKPEIRIDRLINRDGISVEDAKKEVKEREAQHLEKFRRLYAKNDPNWFYWDKKYYDLVINTFDHNREEALSLALKALGIKNH